MPIAEPFADTYLVNINYTAGVMNYTYQNYYQPGPIYVMYVPDL